MYSSLVNVYCKLGLLGDGRKVFDEMPERNSITWSSMISGYATSRMASEAVGFFRHLVCGREVDVNEFVSTSVLSAFVAPQFLNVRKQIHCFGIKNALLDVVSVGMRLLRCIPSVGVLVKLCGCLSFRVIRIRLLGLH